MVSQRKPRLVEYLVFELKNMVPQRKPRLVEYLVFGLKKHGVPEEPVDAVIRCCLTQFVCSHLTVTKSGESVTYDRTENSFGSNWLYVYHYSFLQ